MSRGVQASQELAAQTRAERHVGPGQTSAGNAWRSWWSRPSNKGLALSCLLHVQLCFALTFVAWAAHRPSDEAELIMAVLEPHSARPVQFELSSIEPVGGGGGSTPSAEGFGIPNAALALGSGTEPLIPLPLPVPEKPIAGLNPGPGMGRGRGTGHGDGIGTRKPTGKNAVTEGSFTVWTDPDDPIPGETYTIMIEVRLPEKITRYPRNDLVGLVTGTDGWEQPLPGQRQTGAIIPTRAQPHRATRDRRTRRRPARPRHDPVALEAP